MVEKGTEDIISRLEALRKRVPEEKKPEEKPPVERRRAARMVGILVVTLLIISIVFVGYKFVLKPLREKEIARIGQEVAQQQLIEAQKRQMEQALIEAKTKKIAEINGIFGGLPSEYVAEKDRLISKVNQAPTKEAAEGIDAVTPGNAAWRTYRLAEASKKDPEKVILKIYKIVNETQVEKATYRGIDEIKRNIETLSFSDLKNAVIRVIRYEYVPLRLKRVSAGGFPKEGTAVNIYYRKNENETSYLAKDGKIIAILRAASSGSIALTESEIKTKIGGGVEGYGTVPSLSIGAAASGASLTGTFTGSSGAAVAQTQTTLTVDLIQVQKACAANKISETDCRSILEKYGVKLGNWEEITKFGSFEDEYLLLIQVTDEEAPNLVAKLYTPEDRAKILVTFTSWYAS